jgi:adenylate cyclase
MPNEIERKFLVDRDHPTLKDILETMLPLPIRQGYIMSGPSGVVRVRRMGNQGYLTVKGVTQGITRPEFEYQIPAKEANMMLETMCGQVVEKDRFTIPLPNGPMVEVDVFRQIDLIIAEVELDSEDQVFDKPDWLAEEVSHDPAYYNNNIADRIAAERAAAGVR